MSTVEFTFDGVATGGPKEATGTFNTMAISVLSNGSFPDLKLRRLRNGIIHFDYQILRQTWIASGRTYESLRVADTAKICGFIVRWYAEHTISGGEGTREYDALIDYLLSEDSSKVRLLPI